MMSGLEMFRRGLGLEIRDCKFEDLLEEARGVRSFGYETDG